MIIIGFDQVSQKEVQLKNEGEYLDFHCGTIFNKLFCLNWMLVRSAEN